MEKEKKIKKGKSIDFMGTFTAGCRKGSNMIVNSVFPSIVVAYAIIRVLTLTGVMDILGKLFTPLMFLFGLPGEAAVPLAIGIPTMTGGLGAVAALAQEGILTSAQVAQMTPYFLLCGGIFLYSGRILGVTGVESKNQKWCYLAAFINGVISLWVMKLVLMFF